MSVQSSDLRRDVELLRQALTDKERQLAVLLAETERLQGRPVRPLQLQLPATAVQRHTTLMHAV